MSKLTKKLIDKTPCPADGQVVFRDDLLPGFAPEAYKKCKGLLILEKRIKARMRRMTIEPYGPFTLECNPPEIKRGLE